MRDHAAYMRQWRARKDPIYHRARIKDGTVCERDPMDVTNLLWGESGRACVSKRVDLELVGGMAKAIPGVTSMGTEVQNRGT